MSLTREEEEKRRILSLSLFNIYSSARDDGDSREQKIRSKNAYSGEDMFALDVLKEFFFCASVGGWGGTVLLVFVVLRKRARPMFRVCVAFSPCDEFFCPFSVLHNNNNNNNKEREREREREVERKLLHTRTI